VGNALLNLIKGSSSIPPGGWVVTETTTWQHTTLTRDKYPCLCLRRDSYPQPQQDSGRRPTCRRL